MQGDNNNGSYSELQKVLENFKNSKHGVTRLYQSISALFTGLQKDTGQEQEFFTLEHQKAAESLAESHLKLVVVGQTRSGKSTLLNALLGEEIFPSSDIPCTARVTQMVYSQKKYLTVNQVVDGILIEKKHIEIPHSAKTLPLEAESEISLPESDRLNDSITSLIVEIGWPHPLLQHGLTLVDSPGIAENEILNNLIYNSLHDMLTPIIYVIDGSQGRVREEDKKFFEYLNKSKYNVPILFVCNKIDSFMNFSKKPLLAPAKIYNELKVFFPLLPSNSNECIRYHILSGGSALSCALSGQPYPPQFAEFVKTISQFTKESCDWKIEVLMELCLNTCRPCIKEYIEPTIFQMNNQLGVTEQKIILLEKREKQAIDKIRKKVTDKNASILETIEKVLVYNKDEWIKEAGDLVLAEIDMNNSTITRQDVLQKCASQIATVISGKVQMALVNALRENIGKFSEEIVSEIQVISDELNTSDISLKIALAMNYNTGWGGYIKTGAKGGVLVSMGLTAMSFMGGSELGSLLIGGMLVSLGVVGAAAGAGLMMAAISSMWNYLWTTYRGTRVDNLWKQNVASICLQNFNSKECANQICAGITHQINEMHVKFLEHLKQLQNLVRNREKIAHRKQLMKDYYRKFLEWEVEALSFATLQKGKYDIEEKLGVGTFTVYKGKWNNKEVAIKKSFATEQDQWHRICSEVHYLKHPNIVYYYGCEVVKKENSVTLLMEELAGDMLTLMKNDLISNIKLRVKLALDAAKGLAFLHKNNVIHRDLKCHNILVDKEMKNAKIADFGAATGTVFSSSTIIGTTVTMAPESFDGNYNIFADIYSFSIVLWMIWNNGQIPLNYRHFETLKDFIAALKAGLRPEHTGNKELDNLLRQCWSAFPEHRPPADQVVHLLDNFYQKM